MSRATRSSGSCCSALRYVTTARSILLLPAVDLGQVRQDLGIAGLETLGLGQKLGGSCQIARVQAGPSQTVDDATGAWIQDHRHLQAPDGGRQVAIVIGGHEAPEIQRLDVPSDRRGGFLALGQGGLPVSSALVDGRSHQQEARAVGILLEREVQTTLSPHGIAALLVEQRPGDDQVRSPVAGTRLVAFIARVTAVAAGRLECRSRGGGRRPPPEP